MNTSTTDAQETWETPIAKAYISLFNSVSRAMSYLEENNYGQACEQLKMGQLHAEEIIIDEE